MKIRRDMVFISSVLFSIALFLPMPAMLDNACTWRQSNYEVAEGYTVQNWNAPIGFASLAIIFIGWIVTWAGYVKRVRWTWFVMFIIVWVWFFPVLILPILQHWTGIAPIDWSYIALHHPGLRAWWDQILIFLLMFIALLLPVKSFFWSKERN